MKFSGMICHHPRTNRLDFGSDQVKVTKRLKTYFCHNMLSFRPIHTKPTSKRSLFNSLSSDRWKVKVKVMKRSKAYFGHNTLSFRPIHMKPTSKGSLFNSLSSDMVTDVGLAKVCALPSARSSYYLLSSSSSRLQTPTGRARRQEPEGPSRKDSPVRNEKTLERKGNNNKTK